MKVLEDAQLSPSNCNTQPWNVHIVSGQKLAELSTVLQEKTDAGMYTPDFSFDYADFYDVYSDRQKEQGKAVYEALGIARNDKDGRRRVSISNASFYDAPHVALLFMPSFGDNVRVAGDIGMYGQTFLLSLAARGLGGIPQTFLGFFAGTIREVLGISDEYKLLFGISFGYPDEAALANRIEMGRDPVTDSVAFHF
jgi:nitroreductase